MLYDRDFRNLTSEEKRRLENIENKFRAAEKRNGGGVSSLDLMEYWNSHSFSMCCYKSIFPNNYLIAQDFDDKQKLTTIVDSFQNLLDNGAAERELLNYVKDQKAYYIIGAILNRYDFGHHDAYLFKEFELPPSYKADYLIVGKNSGGFEFVFVECESPSGNITTKNGDWGHTVRKGIKQIEDWNTWIETNYSHLKLVFESKSKPGDFLPKEFYELDKSRIHYAIIAGRRLDFSERTYRLRRKGKRDSNILILHYDNLIDNALQLIKRGMY
jgi:hypothetical protein